MSTTFKLRRGLASEWTSDNPILRAGEPGIELDTSKMKIGDGVMSWNELPYYVTKPYVDALIEAALSDMALASHNHISGPPPFALTDASVITTDASNSNYFRVTLGGNRILGNSNNSSDCQNVVWEFTQDVTGSRILSLDTKFVFGTDLIAITLSTVPETIDFLEAVYHLSTDRWYVKSFAKGFS